MNKEREINFLKERNYAIIKSNNETIRSYQRKIEKMRKENKRLSESIGFLNSLEQVDKMVKCYKGECSRRAIGIMIITYRNNEQKRLPICRSHELINRNYVETIITKIEMEYF